jgi:SAM-dependent methyltransferase
MTDKTSYIASDKPRYIGNLVSRMNCNETLGSRDFEKWVFSHYDFPAGCDVMEVACGTGKALFKLLDSHLQIGSVLALDFAESAVEALRQHAALEGRMAIEAIVEDMEKAPEVLANRLVDHIYSIYGIHYSPRMAELLVEYKRLLKPGGSIFVCGPDSFCNTPLLRILAYSDETIRDPIPERMYRPFARECDLDHLRNHFVQVELTTFENIVSFDNPTTFLAWWENHDLYRPSLVDLVLHHVANEIGERGHFALNKNVLGITMTA